MDNSNNKDEKMIILIGSFIITVCGIFVYGFYYLYKFIKEKILLSIIHNGFISSLVSILMCLGTMVIVTVLNKKIHLNIKYIGLQTFINILNDNIVFLVTVLFLYVLSSQHKGRKKYFIEMFDTIDMIDLKGNTPKLKAYTFIKNDVFSITIETSIPQNYFEKYIDKLEFYTGYKVLKITPVKSQRYIFEFCTETLFDYLLEQNKKQPINFKNQELTVNERIKGVFDYLELDIHNIEVIERVISTTIYFNSSIDIMKINHILPEIKARLKKPNLVLKVANVHKYDYMFQIVKPVNQITYMKVLQEIYHEIGMYEIPLLLGIDMDGLIKHVDMKNHVHYLISGTNGSGKTNNVHNLICTMLLAHRNLSMFLIDTKKDLNCYSNIDNVLRLDADDIDKVIELFTMLKAEMIRRTTLYTKYQFCDSLEKYNKFSGENLPWIIIFIEEYAELLSRCDKSQKEIIEGYVKSLTQLSRSLGYKIFISTQSPRKEVITGIIKANCLNRMCFMVADLTESTIMLGNKEGLNISQVGQYIHRLSGQDEYLQAVYIPENEHRMIIEYLENRNVSMEQIKEVSPIEQIEETEPEAEPKTKVSLSKPMLRRIK
jgi:hypothetical protein